MDWRHLTYAAMGWAVVGCGGSRPEPQRPDPRSFVEVPSDQPHALLRIRFGGYGSPFSVDILRVSIPDLGLDKAISIEGRDVSETTVRIPSGSYKAFLTHEFGDSTGTHYGALEVVQGTEHVLFLYLGPDRKRSVYAYSRGQVTLVGATGESLWREECSATGRADPWCYTPRAQGAVGVEGNARIFTINVDPVTVVDAHTAKTGDFQYGRSVEGAILYLTQAGDSAIARLQIEVRRIGTRLAWSVDPSASQKALIRDYLGERQIHKGDPNRER